jgi:hypothetical protein
VGRRYSATRFYQIDFNSPRPAGLTASSVNFNIKYASKGGGGSGNACIYKIEVRRASNDSLLGTLDHSAARCAAPEALTASSTRTSRLW